MTRQSGSLHRTPPKFVEDEEFVCIRWRKEPLKGSVVESVFWLPKSTVYQEAVIGDNKCNAVLGH